MAAFPQLRAIENERQIGYYVDLHQLFQGELAPTPKHRKKKDVGHHVVVESHVVEGDEGLNDEGRDIQDNVPEQIDVTHEQDVCSDYQAVQQEVLVP